MGSSTSSEPSEHVSVDVADGVATVTIERRERANSLTQDAARALEQAVASTVQPDVRVVVVTGRGDSAFCAGADLHSLAALDASAAERFIRTLHRALKAIREHPAPVIARINGAALGAGLELAMSCDLAVAVAGARLGMPETQVGVPSVIEAALMPSMVGLARARELLLLGDTIDAEEAFRIGLVNEVVPQEGLDAAVDTRVEKVLGLSPVAVSLQKALIKRWQNLPMDEAIEAGIHTFALSAASGEASKAIAEFWKKRS